ncbi:MAG: 2-amino-4-hydroxy-6-hydroxymethyldihydropteridine diphosphokinase, partial [Pseudomonadota bacterium]
MTSSDGWTYAIAVGANQRGRGGLTPRATVGAAFAALDDVDTDVFATSALFDTAPVGPGRRRFVNAALLVVSRLDPFDMLARLHE